eukprot:TRINITY_DN2852_c0_g1_i2.p1 TRINITY_DN2852_c0_g1~~TRINITY_DN2852_c0_g1_i2.p1  ORF type:complete len:552 (+),score=150.53 TRINITY_DN2852_c0_g1_i2:50-1705(+)
MSTKKKKMIQVDTEKQTISYHTPGKANKEVVNICDIRKIEKPDGLSDKATDEEKKKKESTVQSAMKKQKKSKLFIYFKNDVQDPLDLKFKGSNCDGDLLAVLGAVRSCQILNEPSTLKILCGTWNAGDAQGPDDLKEWIQPGYDLYVLGAQECEYKPPTGDCGQHWYGILQQNIGPDYTVVRSKSMGAIRMHIAIKKELFPLVSNVQASSEATGVGRVVHNKGGVAVSFKICETSFLFVNSHLAAHQERIDDRNRDYFEILKGIKIGIPEYECLSQVDHAFWMGDLNYRIDMSRDDCLQKINDKDYLGLIDYDQLVKVKSDDKAFIDFTEPEIEFAPTYKFERGNRTYTAEKMRVPSYCDRILHYSPNGSFASSNTYESAPGIMTSDHSPVMATFTVKIAAAAVLSLSEANRLTSCESAATLVLSNFRGEGLRAMDLNGKSDPYCRFHSNVIPMIPKTNVCKKTLSPNWGTVSIPILSANPEFLKKLSVLIGVFDEDRGSADDVMGSCSLSLAPLISGDHLKTENHEFRIQVLSNSRRAGYLIGSARIIKA